MDNLKKLVLGLLGVGEAFHPSIRKFRPVVLALFTVIGIFIDQTVLQRADDTAEKLLDAVCEPVTSSTLIIPNQEEITSYGRSWYP